MTKNAFKIGLVFLLVLLLAACGDDVPNDVKNEAPIEEPSNNNLEEAAPTENNTEEITDFDLSIEVATKEQIDVDFEVDRNETEAKYEVGDLSLKGAEALTEIEKMFSELNLATEMNEDEVIEQILTYFKVTREDITDFDLDIEFDHQKWIDIDEDQL